MERLKRVDCFDRLCLDVPFEKTQDYFFPCKVRDGKTVLLDRLDLFLHVEMRRRHRAGAAPSRRPAERAGARAERPRQHDIDGVVFQIEPAAAQHASDRDRVPTTTEGRADALSPEGTRDSRCPAWRGRAAA